MQTQRRAWFTLTAVLGLGLIAGGCELIDDILDHSKPGPGGGGGAGGSSGQACRGSLNIDCGDGQFCDFAAPECGQTAVSGVCRAKPEVCTQQYAPVCGCDGKTYGNDCTRLAAGVSKRSDGECANEIEVGEGESCGGFRAPPRRVCAKGLACNDQPGRCGSQAADAPGICETVPTVCTKEFRPVCGCDGKTYGNDCMRKAAGVSLDYTGECRRKGAKEGEFCGGIAGIICNDGLFCEHPRASCNVADGGGTCKRVPQACDASYRPVCGCDGKTYGNDCGRQIAGVPLDHTGECK